MARIKIATINFVKTNPGCDGDDAVAGLGRAVDATKHLLISLEKRGFLRSELVANREHGGRKRLWYFVKDYEPTAEEARKLAELELAPPAPPKEEGGLPIIFQMHQPPMPVRPANARVTTNSDHDRAPLANNGGQGSGRHGVWRNAGAPFARLVLR